MPRADHILCYAETLAGGGVERALLRLARGWLAAGRRVTLVLADASGPLAAELPDGLELVICGNKRRTLARLPGIVRAKRPDVLFCPGSFYTIWALWLRLRLGARTPPTVAKISNAPVRGDHGRLVHAGHGGWLRLQPYFIDRFVAMTAATAHRFAAVAHIPATRIDVIANPPALPLPDAPQPALPPGRFILGVGRLVPQKRWDRLLAALPRLADRSVALVLLGDGAERAALERQAWELGIASRVHLAGHVADPLPAMARAVVLALTSDYEGVPGVLREALAVGTPVVATASSDAIAEIIDDPAMGSIVPRNDPAALVAALEHWLAPGAPRPAPVPAPGDDAAARYLDLFDALTA